MSKVIEVKDYILHASGSFWT